MFMNEKTFRRISKEHGRKKSVELFGDINEHTRLYKTFEADDEMEEGPGLREKRCLLDFNEHFIEFSNGGEHLRSLAFLLSILMFAILPCMPISLVAAMFAMDGLDFFTSFSLILLVGTLTLCYFLWPMIASPTLFTSLCARYRFNRTTGKVYVLRPKRYGGNVVLDWDRVQAHTDWRSSGRMTYDDRNDPTLRLKRQGNLEYAALVLYWPPFDHEDPERKGEDILWVGPDFMFGARPWQYIRTFMEKGMDAVPLPTEKEWLRKGFSSPGESMREQASSSTLVNVLDFIWWPVQSLAERPCYWPTFPEEWNSDCGRRRRESGIGPEEPLRWQARDLDGTEKETPRSGRQPVADGEGDGDGDNRTGEAVENRASPGVLQACRSDGASQETQTRSASGPCHASAALPVLPIVDSQSAAEPLRTAADTASSVELVTTFVDLFVD